MRSRTILLAGVLAALFTVLATPAAAQHCWPAAVALVLHDSAGAVMEPNALDSLEVSPTSSASADFGLVATRINPDASEDRQGALPVLLWSGRGRCRIDMHEVVLRRGATVMRLRLDIHLDTGLSPGPSTYLLHAPPLRTGSWRLRMGVIPPGKSGRYVPIAPQWEAWVTSPAEMILHR